MRNRNNCVALIICEHRKIFITLHSGKILKTILKLDNLGFFNKVHELTDR